MTSGGGRELRSCPRIIGRDAGQQKPRVGLELDLVHNDDPVGFGLEGLWWEDAGSMDVRDASGPGPTRTIEDCFTWNSEESWTANPIHRS